MKKMLLLFGYLIYLFTIIKLFIYCSKGIILISTFILICIPPFWGLFYSRHGEIILRKIRGKYTSLRLNGSCKNLSIGKNCSFQEAHNISIGNNCMIGKYVDLFPLASLNGKYYGGKITIKNNVRIGDYNRFASMDEIVIEDNVLFAAYVHITDHSHEYKNINLPIVQQHVFSKGKVIIHKNAWIGLRAEILSGVTIGQNAVVAACSVVTKDVPAFSVVAGCPAVVIKKYNFKNGKWDNVKKNSESENK